MQKTHTAYMELLELLKELPETFLDDFKALSPQAKLEGYRHTMHLLSYGLDLYMESDPLRPAFVPCAMPQKKMLGDNTDSIYYFTQTRGDQRYRVWGKRGDACFLSFCFYGGDPDGSWSDSIALNVNHTQIEFEEDGSFELFFGPDEPDEPNHFTVGPRSVCLITREYYFDRRNDDIAELHIENTNDVPAPGLLTDDDLAAKFEAVTTFLSQTCAIVPLAKSDEPNVMGEPFTFEPDGMGWGTPDNVYAVTQYDLADDDVLVIHGRSPKCCYWGVQTWNPYMQSDDYRYHRVSRNSSEVEMNGDGTWTVYLSKNELDVPNWIGTAGHSDGLIFCRWLVSETFPETPSAEVVKRDALLARVAE